MLGETGVADRTAWGDLAGCARNVAGLAQAEFHPVTEQQVDDRDGAQRLEQSAEPRHPPRRRDEELELERGAVKDLALHDNPGATEWRAPDRGRSRMVGPDRCAPPAEEPHPPLPQVIDPQAGAIGGGDYANSTRLQHPAELAHHHRRIFDVLDHLMRGDVVENRIGKRQAFQRRLIKRRIAGLRLRDSARQGNRGDVDALDAEPGGLPLQVDGLDSGTTAGIEQMTGHPGREREQPIEISANEISVTAFPQHAVMGRAPIPARGGAMQRLACLAMSGALAADDLVDHRDSSWTSASIAKSAPSGQPDVDAVAATRGFIGNWSEGRTGSTIRSKGGTTKDGMGGVDPLYGRRASSNEARSSRAGRLTEPGFRCCSRMECGSSQTGRAVSARPATAASGGPSIDNDRGLRAGSFGCPHRCRRGRSRSEPLVERRGVWAVFVGYMARNFPARLSAARANHES